MFRTAMIVTACLLVATSATGAILEVQGAARQGAVLSIQGQGFGVKPQAAPLFWSDFENEVIGSVVDGALVPLNSCFEPQPSYAASPLPPSGSIVLRQTFTNTTDACGAYGSAAVLAGLPAGALFVHGSYHVTATDGAPRTATPLVLTGPDPEPLLRVSAYPESGAYELQRRVCPDKYLDVAYGDVAAFGFGAQEWRPMTLKIHPEGAVRVSHGGEPVLSMEATWAPCDAVAPRSLVLWRNVSWADTGTPGDVTVAWNSLYVDTTLMRVELGDAATYEACGFRELQPATDWDETEIRVVVNRGRFADGQSAWLYVFGPHDESVGGPYEITILAGVESGPGRPGRPVPSD